MAPMIFVLLVSAKKSVWPNDKALNLLAGPRPWFAPVWAHFFVVVVVVASYFTRFVDPA